MIEDFLHLPPVSLTPVANLELRISPRIFEKIRNDPNGILRGLGEPDSWKKNQKSKISWHCPFNYYNTGTRTGPLGIVCNTDTEIISKLPWQIIILTDHFQGSSFRSFQNTTIYEGSIKDPVSGISSRSLCESGLGSRNRVFIKKRKKWFWTRGILKHPKYAIYLHSL